MERNAKHYGAWLLEARNLGAKAFALACAVVVVGIASAAYGVLF